jgi:hypothetical protein
MHPTANASSPNPKLASPKKNPRHMHAGGDFP